MTIIGQFKSPKISEVNDGKTARNTGFCVYLCDTKICFPLIYSLLCEDEESKHSFLLMVRILILKWEQNL